jgi:predicted unusual protein kinase regulating ubiquinone biosynthesis (AarF/ABC1/UbiB family)
MMAAIFGVLGANNLRLDKSLTLAMKSLIQAEELITTLSPDFPLIETMFEEGRELLEAEFTPERLAEMAKAEVTATVIELGRRLPSLREATFSWLDQYQRGKFVVTIDTGDLQKGLESVGSVSKNLTVGLIVAGQLVALALVLAIVISNEALDQGLLNLLVLVFVGFLGFSMFYIRRVSRSGGAG